VMSTHFLGFLGNVLVHFSPIMTGFFVPWDGGGGRHFMVQWRRINGLPPPPPHPSPELINGVNVKILFYDIKRTFSFVSVHRTQITCTGPSCSNTFSPVPSLRGGHTISSDSLQRQWQEIFRSGPISWKKASWASCMRIFNSFCKLEVGAE
jgi:hypothetical protein